MKTRRLGGLTVHAAGGDDGAGSGDGPAVVLCHGFGAPGDDLVALHEVVDAGPRTRWFFPEAPIDLGAMFGMPARAWWPLDMMELDRILASGRVEELARSSPDATRGFAAGIHEARAALERCLEGLEQEAGLDPARTVLGGFSQGAMLSVDLALAARERPFAGLAVLSGMLIEADRWTASAKVVGPGLHVLQSHGKHDPLLPFSLAQRLRDVLAAAGAEVELVTFAGGHEIPGFVLEALGRFCRARLP